MKFDAPFFFITLIFAENVSKFERVLVSSTDRLVAFRDRVRNLFLKKGFKLL